jgi:hypothetical protein
LGFPRPSGLAREALGIEQLPEKQLLDAASKASHDRGVFIDGKGRSLE